MDNEKNEHSYPKQLNDIISMDLSVIIITKDRPEEIQSLVSNINDQTCTYTYEIIIIDSSEETIFNKNRNFLKKQNNYKHIKALIPKKSSQRNLGIQNSNSELLLFLDDDVILKANYLENIIGIANKNIELAGLTGFVINQKEFSIVEKLYRNFFLLQDVNKYNTTRKLSGFYSFNNNPKQLQETICLWGCNMLIRKHYLTKRKFNNAIKYFDDIDISIQILKQGGNLFISNIPKLLHCRTSKIRTKASFLFIHQSHALLKIIIYYREYYRLPFFLWSLIGNIFLTLITVIFSYDLSKGTYVNYEKYKL